MNPEFSILKDFLKLKGMRLTPQRKTILETFLKCAGHFQAEDLFREVQKRDPRVGIATIYRTLSLLVKASLAREQTSHNGKRFYELKIGKAHHDHLICLHCGEIIEFEHPLIEQFQKEEAAKNGFELLWHHMVIYGVCHICHTARNSSKSRSK